MTIRIGNKNLCSVVARSSLFEFAFRSLRVCSSMVEWQSVCKLIRYSISFQILGSTTCSCYSCLLASKVFAIDHSSVMALVYTILDTLFTCRHIEIYNIQVISLAQMLPCPTATSQDSSLNTKTKSHSLPIHNLLRSTTRSKPHSTSRPGTSFHWTIHESPRYPPKSCLLDTISISPLTRSINMS